MSSASFALILWIVCGSLAALCDKKATTTMPWQAVGFVYDAIVVLVLPFYWYAFRGKIRFADFTLPGVAWSVAASVIGLVCFFAYFVALKDYEASRLNAYGLLDVALAAVLCALFLGESITAPKVFGILLMMAGAYALGR